MPYKLFCKEGKEQLDGKKVIMKDAGTVKHYKKKELLETISMLERANDAVIRFVKTNPGGAAEALTFCQESAILMGTDLENKGNEYADLVSLLEDYCENIFRMSEAMPDEFQCRKIAKRIQKQLIRLRQGIISVLPNDRKEVVFLPYKASMWDSLESVWKAADADPDCDAYVIPIPYFDKNPDRSFKEEHYEGDLYPKDVPITRYDEYDLEAHHPNVIYIHNPYDDCNQVTSVHPYFYSKNLRNFTDKLIYVPYFILSEIEPDDQTAVDGMKHFCFMPGTIYADQVVVQSENMRQIYINEYIKAAKEIGLSGEHVDRNFLEKKFLGTGSPKIDKLLNTKKEDLEIPAEWMKIIEKPDGSWKKIVFYNTSVGALLEYGEKMLRKMESVFEIFKENRDEVALLWRPHPLIQATIESMKPQLWEEYKEIRDRYIKEEWGIYDDTADVNRAVVISDMYYGDPSSVKNIYDKARKPIIMQNISYMDKTNGLFVVDDFEENGNDIYFLTTGYINALWKYCAELKKIKLIYYFGIGAVYKVLIKKGKRLYLPPGTERRIAVYDLKAGSMSFISISQLDIQMRGVFYNEYRVAVEIGDKLLCLGHPKTVLLIIDIVNNTAYVVNQTDYVSILRQGVNIYTQKCNPCVIGNVGIMTANVEGMVVEYDLCKNTVAVRQIDNVHMVFNTIVYDGEAFWLSGNEEYIIRWVRETNEIEKLNVAVKGFSKKGDSCMWSELFSNAIYTGDCIIYSPLKANAFLKVYTKTKTVEVIRMISDDEVCFQMKKIGSRILVEIDDISHSVNRESFFFFSEETPDFLRITNLQHGLFSEIGIEQLYTRSEQLCQK